MPTTKTEPTKTKPSKLDAQIERIAREIIEDRGVFAVLEADEQDLVTIVREVLPPTLREQRDALTLRTPEDLSVASMNWLNEQFEHEIMEQMAAVEMAYRIGIAVGRQLGGAR